jgi:type II secretory pathway pseudopilin PulG
VKHSQPNAIMTQKTNGFALIDLLFVCGLVGVLSAIALPRLTLAKQAAGAASAVAGMRTINSAELTFALTCGSGFYAPNLTTLGTAPAGSREPFISPDLGAGNVITKSGYIVQIQADAFAGAPSSCNGLPAGQAGQGFKAVADATEPSNPRFFATNANGLTYEHTASLLTVIPEVGIPAAGHPIR